MATGIAPTPADRAATALAWELKERQLAMFGSSETLPGRTLTSRGGGAAFRFKTIDPRSSVMRNWDSVVALLLMFTCIVTPFEVAFIRTSPFLSAFFIINRLVDILFTIDVCINFGLMYFGARRLGCP